MLKSYHYPHEVAITAILKNEGSYIKEWLDYHIAAGITKFYLYDNDSTDNVTEVLRPYIERGTVEYIFFPGRLMQYKAYNDAVYRHKFDCRYMAIIDLDEFIYPCTGQDIPTVVAELFSADKNAGGLAINWRIYGSSGQDKRDLSRGVLERFTHRGHKEFSANLHIKSIVNPRCVDMFPTPHYALYFVGKYAVNELGDGVPKYENPQLSGQKIVINHYFTKSREEFAAKRGRGMADLPGQRPWDNFDKHDANDVFDDGILTYRAKMLTNSVADKDGQLQDVIGTIAKDFPQLSASDLTCRLDDLLAYRHFCCTELSHYMGKGKRTDYFTKSVMSALQRAFSTEQELWQIKLFISVLPQLLSTDKELVLEAFYRIVPPLQEYFLDNRLWRNYQELLNTLNFCRMFKK